MATYRTTQLERIEWKTPKIQTASKLPLVVDDWTLAFQLGFRGKFLWYVLSHRADLYKVYKIKKATGGMRTIHDPRPSMKLFLKILRARILLPLAEQLGAHVVAYQVGKSTRDAAALHLKMCPVCEEYDQPHTCFEELIGDVKTREYSFQRHGVAECPACKPSQRHVCTRRGVKIHMDLKDFFGSTKRSWVRQYFHNVVGYNHYVSSMLASALTVDLKDGRRSWAGVPQGSPCSGDICNLVADWRLDTPLLETLKKTGWTYTRYADDLYFSHTENLSTDAVDLFINQVTKTIIASGYRVNKKKLHVQRAHKRQALLGVVLNQKLNIPSDAYRRLRSLLHNCIVHGFDTQWKRAKRTSEGRLHSWLLGKISYMSMVAPHKAEHLKLMYHFATDIHARPNPFGEKKGKA